MAGAGFSSPGQEPLDFCGSPAMLKTEIQMGGKYNKYYANIVGRDKKREEKEGRGPKKDKKDSVKDLSLTSLTSRLSLGLCRRVLWV